MTAIIRFIPLVAALIIVLVLFAGARGDRKIRTGLEVMSIDGANDGQWFTVTGGMRVPILGGLLKANVSSPLAKLSIAQGYVWLHSRFVKGVLAQVPDVQSIRKTRHFLIDGITITTIDGKSYFFTPTRIGMEELLDALRRAGFHADDMPQ